jgi:hypothetical protein
MFFLNGFGYMADSLILLLQSVTAGQAAREFLPSFTRGLTVAAYSGMLIGALFCKSLLGDDHTAIPMLLVISTETYLAKLSPKLLPHSS